jgi:hypothetical protein
VTAGSSSLCQAYRERIEQGVTAVRNAMGIFQTLADQHGFTGSYKRETVRAEAVRSTGQTGAGRD